MVKEKVLHTNDKAIIVSQWPSMLNLINKQLSQYYVKTETFSGAVPILQRNKLVNEFNNIKGGPKVNIMTSPCQINWFAVAWFLCSPNKSHFVKLVYSA